MLKHHTDFFEVDRSNTENTGLHGLTTDSLDILSTSLNSFIVLLYQLGKTLSLMVHASYERPYQ